MTKPKVAFPDAEIITKDLLQELMIAEGEDADVRIGVPANWKPSDGTLLEVAWDGTPLSTPLIVAHATIRVVAHAGTSVEAKRVALLAEGLLVSHTGQGDTAVIRSLTGVQPARDPETHAELAAFTVRVTVRSIPI